LGVFYALFLLPVTVAASSQTYFPLNRGDVKSYYYDYNGRQNQVMQLSYVSSQNGVSGSIVVSNSLHFWVISFLSYVRPVTMMIAIPLIWLAFVPSLYLKIENIREG
jgi:hypothetical protein